MRFSRITHSISSNEFVSFSGLTLLNVANALQAAILGDTNVNATVELTHNLDSATLVVKSATPFTLNAMSVHPVILGPSSTDGLSSRSITLQILGRGIVDGDNWTITFNGKDYTFTAGNKHRVTEIASVDVEIADNEAPGVRLTQSFGSTNVVEPIENGILGSGQVTAPSTVPQVDWSRSLATLVCRKSAKRSLT